MVGSDRSEATALRIIERASIAVWFRPSFATVRTIVARATDGAAPKSPAKLFGFNVSLRTANMETMIPPKITRIRICVSIALTVHQPWFFARGAGSHYAASPDGDFARTVFGFA